MSGFNTLIDLLSANIGVSTETAIMIVFLMPCILFFAANFKVGIVSSLAVTAGLFVYFVSFGYQYDVVLIIMLLLVVVMSFTLYFIKTQETRGIA